MRRMGSLIRHNDVAGWGVAALVCGAFAVFTANVAGFIPDSVLVGLQVTRVQGGTFSHVRLQVADVQSNTTRITSDYRALLSRFNLLDDDRGEMVRRLAAVERSLPLLIESLPFDSDIDRALLTSSIAATSPEVYESDGVMISVRHTPLFDDFVEAETEQRLPPVAIQIPMESVPAPMASGLDMQGIAIGPLFSPADAAEIWTEILGQVGPLLLGTVPLLETSLESNQARIIVGPLTDSAAAETLCSRLLRVGISCDLTSYAGQPLL